LKVASRSDVEAGKAHVSLYVKGLPGVQQAMRGVSVAVAAAGAAIAALGASVMTGLGLAVNSFVELGSTLNDMSARTGLSASKLAVLRYAAQQTGATLEDLERGLRNMVRQGMSANDFEAIAREIAAIEDPSLRAARALEVFGRSGMMLLPMIMQLQSLQARAAEVGIGITDADVAIADELGDRIDDLTTSWQAMVFQVGAALAPILLDILSIIQPIVSAVSKWVAENRQIAVAIAGVALAMVAVGSAALVFAGVLAAITAAVGAIALLIASGWTTVIVAGIAALVGVLASAVATVAALTAAWMAFTKEGQTTWRLLSQAWDGFVSGAIERWGPFARALLNTFGDVAAALRNGDIENAWGMLCLNMLLVWEEFRLRILTDIAELTKAMNLQFNVLGGVGDETVSTSELDSKVNELRKLLDTMRGARDIAGGLFGGAKAAGGGGGESVARTSLIGFNARSALLSSNIMGPAAAETPTVDAIASLGEMLMGPLVEIARNTGDGLEFN
jgi:hypothetical protein